MAAVQSASPNFRQNQPAYRTGEHSKSNVVSLDQEYRSNDFATFSRPRSSMIGLPSHSSSKTKRPSSRDSTSGHFKSVRQFSDHSNNVKGLLLDQDGEMHDPGYAESLKTLRAQLEHNHVGQLSPESANSWRINHGLHAGSGRAHSNAFDSDDSGEELPSSRVSYNNNAQRKSPGNKPEPSWHSLDSPWVSTSAQHDGQFQSLRPKESMRLRSSTTPGSALASPAVPAPASIRDTDGGIEVMQDDSPATLSHSEGRSRNQGSSSKLRRIGSRSRSRTGSMSSCATKGSPLLATTAFDDWQGGFTGIVDVQREERSRRNSEEATYSSHGLGSAASSRPGTASASGSYSRHGSDNKHAEDARDGTEGRRPVEKAMPSNAGGYHANGSNFRRPSLPSLYPSKRRGSQSSGQASNNHALSSESLAQYSNAANNDTKWAPTPSQPQGTVAATTATPSRLQRLSPVMSRNGSTGEGRHHQNRTSPMMATQDLPLLTPLDENGGYRDYYMSFDQGVDSAIKEKSDKALPTGSENGMRCASVSSLEASNDAMNSVRRKMQSVSLGVKFKAMKAEKKFKKKFGGESQGRTRPEVAMDPSRIPLF
ncbi:unnamed protein product [Sympodiomycopsis kandeliae]